MSNSYGNGNRGIRQFLRSVGMKPNVSNVERIGRELRRSESQNDTVERISREVERERGVAPTRDAKGDVQKRIQGVVQKKIAQRKR